MNKKIAVVFPGQGSQCLNMGNDLLEYRAYSEIFDLACQYQSDLKQVITEDEQKLNDTLYAQLALVTNQIGTYNVLNELFEVKVDATCGFSLGEYSAYYVAQIFDVNNILKVIKSRSENMAKLNNSGTMKAVIGLTIDQVNELLAELNQEFNTNISVANYNLKNQIVIAGLKSDFALIDEKLNQAARRVVELKVSGAFHTSQYAEVAQSFIDEIKDVTFNEVQTDLYSNLTADKIDAVDLEYLKLHMTNGVNWYDEIIKMINDGITTFVEIGPKPVVSNLIKKIDRSVEVIHVSDQESMKKLEDLWTRK